MLATESTFARAVPTNFNASAQLGQPNLGCLCVGPVPGETVSFKSKSPNERRV